MKERRPLIAGIHPVSSDVHTLEKQFVYGGRTEHLPEPVVNRSEESAEIGLPSQSTAVVPEDRIQPQITGRVPITTRTRPEVATALKRASLQRQLAGVEPFYVQDIMEEALEMWLRAKSFL